MTIRTARDQLVEQIAMELCAMRGFGFYTDPMEGGQDAYEISCEALREAGHLFDKFEIVGRKINAGA
jgi:hypothetical protein